MPRKKTREFEKLHKIALIVIGSLASLVFFIKIVFG
jgi:hypothetical protein